MLHVVDLRYRLSVVFNFIIFFLLFLKIRSKILDSGQFNRVFFIKKKIRESSHKGSLYTVKRLPICHFPVPSRNARLVTGKWQTFFYSVHWHQMLTYTFIIYLVQSHVFTHTTYTFYLIISSV
jgi:hypothetical protein